MIRIAGGKWVFGLTINANRRFSIKNWLVASIVTLFVAVGNTATAMPPYVDESGDVELITQTQSILQSYSELHADWLAKGIDQPANLDFQAWLNSGASTSKNILCILIKSPDKQNITDAACFDTLVYANQVGSVRHYYNEVSYNQLDIVTVNLPSSLGWLTAPNIYSYYVNGNYGTGDYPNNCQKLVEDAVDLVDPVVDFADYDNDGDGYVDGLMVVHSGRGAELTHSRNDIWSHKWAITPRLKDDKYIFVYSMMPEYWSTAGDMTCGVFCHELGHVFGLPDLYDRDYSSRGIGRWSIMSSGAWNGTMGDSPAHFDAWSLIKLGFTSYTNVTSTIYNAKIPDVESSGRIYRLWTSGEIGDEYFLIENRGKTGYDAALPGEGLLIWHIDDSCSHNDQEWYPGYTSSGHYKVALVQADNNWSLEKNQGYGDAGDPFPGSSGNCNFTPFTTLNSSSYSGDDIPVAVTNISAAGNTITANLSVSFTLGTDDDETNTSLPAIFTLKQNYPNPFNSSTSIEYYLDTAGEVEIQILNVLGQAILNVHKGIQAPGAHSLLWDSKDTSGNQVASGIYFCRLTLNNKSQIRKILYLK